jgi:hypothetical protein
LSTIEAKKKFYGVLHVNAGWHGMVMEEDIKRILPTKEAAIEAAKHDVEFYDDIEDIIVIEVKPILSVKAEKITHVRVNKIS